MADIPPIVDVIMPRLGETVVEGTVTRWFKRAGDPVEVDETLFEVSTDKVDTEVPSPATGVVWEILAGEGDDVEVGQVLARIGDPMAIESSSAEPSPQTPSSAEPSPQTPPSAEPSPEESAHTVPVRSEAEPSFTEPGATTVSGRMAEPPAAGPGTRGRAGDVAAGTQTDHRQRPEPDRYNGDWNRRSHHQSRCGAGDPHPPRQQAPRGRITTRTRPYHNDNGERGTPHRQMPSSRGDHPIAPRVAAVIG